MKNPTFRKLKRKGLAPIRYRGPDQVHHGWIEKTGRKWMYLRLIDRAPFRTRVPVAEIKYIAYLGG